jgi:hypothetical protein
MLVWWILTGCADPGPEEGTYDPTAVGGWPDAELPPCEVPHTGIPAVGPYGSCVDRLAWDEACEAEPGELDQGGLRYVGGADVELWESAPPVSIVRDEVAWEVLSQGLSASMLPVDFDSEMVVVVVDFVPETCGGDIVLHGVGEVADGSTGLFVVFDEGESASGGCRYARAMVVAYAIPRDDPFPLICATAISQGG